MDPGAVGSAGLVEERLVGVAHFLAGKYEQARSLWDEGLKVAAENKLPAAQSMETRILLALSHEREGQGDVAVMEYLGLMKELAASTDRPLAIRIFQTSLIHARSEGAVRYLPHLESFADERGKPITVPERK